MYDASGIKAGRGRKALVTVSSREESIIANALESGIGVAQATVLVNLDRERRQVPPISYSAVQRYQSNSSAIDMHKRSTKKSGLGDPESIWAKVTISSRVSVPHALVRTTSARARARARLRMQIVAIPS